MNKVLLIDVDSKIPNLALMKLSTYYKEKSYEIVLKQLGYNGYPNNKKITTIKTEGYKLTFISIIFTVNKKVLNIENNNNIFYGGTGYDLTIKLSKEIDNCEEDYTIYPNNNKSYGFITRGCIRNCSFCFVPKKEGLLYFYKSIEKIVKHKEVIFMDNNILAYDKHKLILKELIDKNIKCQFNQGLDIRLIDQENAELLSKLNYIGEYIFAFDDYKYKKIIENKLDIFKKYINQDWKIKMFLYTSSNYNTLKEDIDRINWCKNNKILPYYMRNNLCWENKNRNMYIDLAAYCNQPNIFKKMNFGEFIKKRTNNIKRQEISNNLWEYNK